MSERPVLAADIGGTMMRAALVDRGGRILERRLAPTPHHSEVPSVLIDLLRTMGSEDAHGPVSHAVVGLPGPVDYELGRLLWAPHLPEGWPELLGEDELRANLDQPVSVANDADLAAVGEALLGAGVGHHDVAYLTISTGIGAGVVQQGHLVRGRRSLGEVGHTVIDLPAWRTGGPSTLEELGSGSGLARLARDAGLGDLDAAGVEAAAAAGSARAAAIWEGAISACAVGVANVVLAFSPDVVVVGGGLGRSAGFFAPVCGLVRSRAAYLPLDLAIVPSALGDDAGLAGAARWDDAVGRSRRGRTGVG